MAVGKKHFTLELNEKEVTELLENATPGSKKKITQKFLKVKTWKLYFDNLNIHVSQSKTMQVETIYLDSLLTAQKRKTDCRTSWN